MKKYTKIDWDNLELNEQLDILEKSNCFLFNIKGLKATLTPELKEFCKYHEIENSYHWQYLVENNRDEFVGRKLPIFLLEDSKGYNNSVTLHNMDIVLNGNDAYSDYPENDYLLSILKDNYYEKEIDNKKIIDMVHDGDIFKKPMLIKELVDSFTGFAEVYGKTDITADHINDLIGDLLMKDIGENIKYKHIDKEVNKEYLRELSYLMARTMSESPNVEETDYYELQEYVEKMLFMTYDSQKKGIIMPLIETLQTTQDEYNEKNSQEKNTTIARKKR